MQGLLYPVGLSHSERVQVCSMMQFGYRLLILSPQFRNPTKSLRSLRSKPPRMRFLLFKLTFCHILTDMSA